MNQFVCLNRVTTRWCPVASLMPVDFTLHATAAGDFALEEVIVTVKVDTYKESQISVGGKMRWMT